MEARRVELQKKIAIPEGTPLLPPKPNEELSKVKRDRNNNIKKVVYTDPRMSFEGIRAKEGKVKFIPQQEAADRAPKHRYDKFNVRDLRQVVVEWEDFIRTEHRNWSSTTRGLGSLDRKLERENRDLKARVAALEKSIENLGKKP